MIYEIGDEITVSKKIVECGKVKVVSHDPTKSAHAHWDYIVVDPANPRISFRITLAELEEMKL